MPGIKYAKLNRSGIWTAAVRSQSGFRVTLVFVLAVVLFAVAGLICSPATAQTQRQVSEVNAVDFGDNADNRNDRLVRLFLYCTACWKNRPTEELSGYSEVLGDGDTDYYPMEMVLCDQFRIVTRSLLGDSLEYGESIVDNDDVIYTSSDESIFEISDDGKLTLHKKGKAVLTVLVRGGEMYRDCTVRIPVNIIRETGFLNEAGQTVRWSSTDQLGITVTTADGPQQLQVLLKPGASVTYSSQFPDIADVDANGLVTPVSPGKTKIYTYCGEGDHGQFDPCLLYNEITVTGEDIRLTQTIEGNAGNITIGCGETVQLQMTAMTELSYRSLNEDVASVSSDGIITGKKAGMTTIVINAASSKEYLSASSEMTVIVRDYEAERELQEEEARQKEEERLEQERQAEETRRKEAERLERERQAEEARQETARKKLAAIRQAQSLKTPKFKCSAKKRKNKLMWSRVAGASGYELYIKYPGSKKYVKALTKDASVKSVTHRGLTRKRKYSYKIRAFAVVDGKYYYGPFSKAKTIKVK